ncbi:hypothetical protein Peur_053621 [Populus x canadensis]
MDFTCIKLATMRKIAHNSQNLPLKRGAWSPEEDQKLIAYINRHGIQNWIEMPKAAAKLPGRTDNEIKNFWNTRLKKNYVKNNINTAAQAPKLQGTQTSTAEFKKRKLSENIDVPLPTAPKILKPEDSEGSPKLPISYFSSSFNLVNDLIINENQIIEENVGLLESNGEQCLWGPQFSTEGQTCRVEDYGDTCTVEMWVQELLHGV